MFRTGCYRALERGFPEIDGTVLRVREHQLVMEISAQAESGKACRMKADGDYCEHAYDGSWLDAGMAQGRANGDYETAKGLGIRGRGAELGGIDI